MVLLVGQFIHAFFACSCLLLHLNMRSILDHLQHHVALTTSSAPVKLPPRCLSLQG